MVSPEEIERLFDMSRTTLWRLTRDRRIPVHEERKRPWHKRTVQRYRVSEVQAALDDMGKQPPKRYAPPREP